MSEKKNSRLTDHIRKVLYVHEEPYAPGAWEAFQQHRKRKSRIFVGKVVLGVAASLALVLSVMFILNEFADPIHQQTVAEYQEKTDAGSADKSVSQRKPAVTTPEPSDFSNTLPAKVSVEVPEPPDDSEIEVSRPATDRNTFSGIPRRPSPVLLASEAMPVPPGVQKTAEHTETTNWSQSYREFHQRRVVTTEKDKVFSFGLAYAPLMNGNDTKTDWSMGGGFYTEWAFARNLALSSGVLIAQNQLEYDRRTDMEGAGAENLAYVQVDLVSLEIPLNLRYYLTDNISVSAGISSAAFLRESYNYTYEYQREVQLLNYTEGSGIEPISERVTLTREDRQSEPSFNSMDWAAFYTFSFGYQYDIADKHTLSVEPFMKFPSGNLTTRNIKYYTGGLQVKFSF